MQGVGSLSSPGCRQLYRGVCQHCSKLTIEVSYQKEGLASFDASKTSASYRCPIATQMPCIIGNRHIYAEF